MQKIKSVVVTDGRFTNALMANPTTDYLEKLAKGLVSVADFEEARRKNMLNIYTSKEKGETFRHTYWACACGSRQFYVVADRNNIELKCVECGNSDIIAWTQNCHVMDLHTGEWCKPKAQVTVERR